ncbi:hypothetical protein MOQ_001065 [Trypanosoma cruzi marinkellei]|uniref:ER membrane protein complex subunit 7 beta-sandwich domain-containing protein n=1 Tax=Trypanosoma cruzi marinkellei TaxID=85056 RepID=K2NLT1_TRYCR|nr:hypothetical protein MOQ_001065 [Trypanosoma cruzi marinkellei]
MEFMNRVTMLANGRCKRTVKGIKWTGYNTHIILLFFLFFFLCTVNTVAGEVETHDRQLPATTLTYYGRLLIHPNFYQHPDSTDPLWRVQGGEVVLSNGVHIIRVPTKLDGSFVLYDVPYGAYHLHAEYANFIYPTVRVDVTQKTIQGIVRPIIRTYTNDGTMLPVQGTGLDDTSPAIIPFTGVHAYYVPREQYSIMNFLMNPMILLMLVSMGMMGLMQLVPEEDRKESTREMQRLRRQLAGEDVEGKRL